LDDGRAVDLSCTSCLCGRTSGHWFPPVGEI